jgi:hypothetical protein
METFTIDQTVKYSTPEEDEEDSRFIVFDIAPANDGLGEKLYVQLVCEGYLKPTFCYFSTEFTNA